MDEPVRTRCASVVGSRSWSAFAVIETKVPDPMFRLKLFRIRAFTAGSLSSLLAGIGRGGLMFMLIIWLQGIWLPLHGYRLQPDATVGRDLHAAVDGRVLGRRPDLGDPVGPIRVETVLDGRDDRGLGLVPVAGASSGELLVSGRSL